MIVLIFISDENEEHFKQGFCLKLVTNIVHVFFSILNQFYMHLSSQVCINYSNIVLYYKQNTRQNNYS